MQERNDLAATSAAAEARHLDSVRAAQWAASAHRDKQDLAQAELSVALEARERLSLQLQADQARHRELTAAVQVCALLLVVTLLLSILLLLILSCDNITMLVCRC